MKNIVFLFISLLIAFSLHAQNPSFQWVKSNQGYQGRSTAVSVKLDSLGYIYVLGRFSGTIDFNPSPSNATWLSSTLTGDSYYIQKLDSNGNLVWVRSVDFRSGSFRKIDIDPTGRLYIIGNFEDSVDIDPGSSVHMLYSNGNIDAFILKLSANGNFIWAKSFGGLEDDVASDLVTDSQGNVYTHGYYSDTVDFDPGLGTCIYGAGYTPAPMNDPLSNAFIQKLDINGNFIWAKAFLNSEYAGYSLGMTICIDSYNNVYCSGDFGAGIGIDFDPGNGVSTPPTNAGNWYLIKLDSSGSFIWSKYPNYIGSWGYLSAYAMKIDRYNNVYTTGVIGGNIDFDPGPDTLLLTESTFIQKYDQNGNFLWAKSYGYGDQPTAITTDTFGNVYSTGMFMDSTDLDPGLDTLIFYTFPNNWYDYGAYVQKLNSNGDFLWAGVLQGNLGSSIGYDISVDNTGNVFLAGEFVDTVDFDPSSSVHNLVSANPPWSSSFLLKLSQCKTLTTDHITTCDSLIWMDGVTYYQSTQSAYFTLPSAAGCDSVIVLNLNIPVIDTTISVSPYGVFSSNQNATSYQWLDCNSGLISLVGDTLQSFTPTVNGNYAVEINVNGCMDTSACVNINNVSIEELTENTIKLYPNPNTGKFTLNLGNLRSAEIKILNSMGQELMFVQGKNSNYFDLELKPGVYFIQIRDNEVVKTLRFVVN